MKIVRVLWPRQGAPFPTGQAAFLSLSDTGGDGAPTQDVQLVGTKAPMSLDNAGAQRSAPGGPGAGCCLESAACGTASRGGSCREGDMGLS